MSAQFAGHPRVRQRGQEAGRTITSAVTGIYDKGSGALVVTENAAVDVATGEPLVTAANGAGERRDRRRRVPCRAW